VFPRQKEIAAKSITLRKNKKLVFAFILKMRNNKEGTALISTTIKKEPNSFLNRI